LNESSSPPPHAQEDGVALSVVVAIVSDTVGPSDPGALADCLEALTHQVDAPETEIIVPYLSESGGFGPVRERFPNARFLPVVAKRSGRGREHHDVLRARGLLAARGRVVALVEDHGVPDPEFCARVVDAHSGGSVVVGGAIENRVDRVLNWAVYFCDFGRYQNPVPSGPSPFASDANISYAMDTLRSVQPIWQEAFSEVVVNQELSVSGVAITLRGDIVVRQNRTGLSMRNAMLERFVWGRSYGATRAGLTNRVATLTHALVTPLLPLLLSGRIGRVAWSRGRLRSQFIKALPAIVLLQVAWSAGELAGSLKGLPE
jgi:hypothetical protein